MVTVTIELPSETEKTLRAKASRDGKSLEAYLLDLIQKDAQAANGAIPAPTDRALSPADFEQSLDELSADLPALPRLPVQLSRGDFYGEHD